MLVIVAVVMLWLVVINRPSGFLTIFIHVHFVNAVFWISVFCSQTVPTKEASSFWRSTSRQTTPSSPLR